jgi:hypothetical protein
MANATKQIHSKFFVLTRPSACKLFTMMHFTLTEHMKSRSLDIKAHSNAKEVNALPFGELCQKYKEGANYHGQVDNFTFSLSPSIAEEVTNRRKHPDRTL